MSDSAAKPLLRVSDVCVIYPGHTTPTIEHISFELHPNTITMLIGPNGSGKSTLLRAIIGALEYTGTITLFEPDNPATTNARLRNRVGIGYVPQRLDFDVSLPVTVHDFLSLALITCRHDKKAKERYIIESLAHVNAESLHHALLGSLSGGQRQRVVLARALIHHPRILILDEPETGVDISGEQQFYGLLKKLVTKHDITAFIASHELEIVHEYADQVLCINKTLVCSGKPKTALTTETFQHLYGSGRRHVHHDPAARKKGTL